jgi:6,7-dimethyl-8-ribityllumazine synthase
MTTAPHLLIIDARFYETIADTLVTGAEAALDAAAATHDRVSVPGVLEIPAALAMALGTRGDSYDGYVVLGCVIRGETTHYDIVAEQSARTIMNIVVRHSLALGNGILTVEDKRQAQTRARVAGRNKGGQAAKAALTMIELRRDLLLHRHPGR